MRERILVVDDEARIREIVSDHLTPEGYEVVQAADGEEAVRLVEQNDLSLVLLDLAMPSGEEGVEALEQIAKLRPSLPVIIVSGTGTIEKAIRITKLGAYDFLEKPVLRERLLIAVRNALERDRMRREVALLKEEALKRYQMIGVSEALQRIFKLVDEIANTRVPVLITGESGGGKELVARAIHNRSNRRDRAFVKLNCAAIVETLTEAELFGYEKGAFTGALTQKRGKLELAHNGTLFLDEIGDLSPASQAKVLRFLQESEFERVGGTQTIKVDVRFISATNKNLEQEIVKKSFREDLYYRLNVVHIHVPPLRERKEDIPVLADYFLEQQCVENGVPKKRFSPQAIEVLKNQPWKGNVRELENLVKRAAVLVKAEEISPHDLVQLEKTHSPEAAASEEGNIWREAKAKFERELILKTLAENNWDKSKTAESLGIERAHLYRKMKELEISE